MMTTTIANAGGHKIKSYNAATTYSPGAKVTTAAINDAGYSRWQQDAGVAIKDASIATATSNKAKNAGSSNLWQTTEDYTSATNAVSDANSTTGINATSPDFLLLPPSAVAVNNTSPAMIAKEAASTDVITASMPPGVTIAKDEPAGINIIIASTPPDATMTSNNPPDKDENLGKITDAIKEKSIDAAAGFDLG